MKLINLFEKNCGLVVTGNKRVSEIPQNRDFTEFLIYFRSFFVMRLSKAVVSSIA